MGYNDIPDISTIKHNGYTYVHINRIYIYIYIICGYNYLTICDVHIISKIHSWFTKNRSSARFGMPEWSAWMEHRPVLLVQTCDTHSQYLNQTKVYCTKYEGFNVTYFLIKNTSTSTTHWFEAGGLWRILWSTPIRSSTKPGNGKHPESTWQKRSKAAVDQKYWW